jgi:two-component system competent response regulator ComA
MEGIKLMLEKEVDFAVTIASPYEDALLAATSNRYDVMLFDLNMPGMNGIELSKRVLAEVPDAVILIHTGFDITPHFNQLIGLGVAGFVPKTATRDHLVHAIRCAIRKEAVIPLALLRELRKDGPGGALDASGAESKHLNARELDILREVAKGRSNKAIAEKMHMSQRSLEYGLTQIFQKLSVHSRIEAVTKSKQMGLLMDGDFI